MNNTSTEFCNDWRERSLLQSRSLMISEGVTSSTAEKIVSNLLVLDNQKVAPIYIYLNSPGGEINSGFSIYDTIKYIESEVIVINTGLCASIATIINIAAKKGNRYSMENSRFLIHQPLISGQIFAQASDVEITAEQMSKIRDRINQLLAQECGQKFEKIEKDCVRDYWMSAKEALEYGLIDKIISSKKEITA
jgi:ATP-dependent Clp protease, protease subunit